MPLADQIVTFAYTLAIGMLAGLCYEVYRAVRDLLKLKSVGTFAGDIIFWLLLTVIAFVLLIRANYGQLRFYVFVGLLLGTFLFIRLLGGVAYRLVRWVLYQAGKVLRLVALLLYYLWMAVSFPFRLVFITVVFPVHLAGRLLGRAGRLAGRPAGWIRGRVNLAAERLAARFRPPG